MFTATTETSQITFEDALTEGYTLLATLPDTISFDDDTYAAQTASWAHRNRRFHTPQSFYDMGAEWNDMDLLHRHIEREIAARTESKPFWHFW
jgi:hypothetical protein